ncbi:hypothetical protein TELCIR_14505 [Teladorsagia circumcincta]|uniref:Peptidase C1A papain C-terminal domain-containing protein n=1 Tax=Teladorsagia circumcincta TaxID=45464 RepID=A0A2G9U2E6_TELCI|nr:hypothetical protein TELCIR_14505 [Teladorsagia circumcincta]
MNGSYMRNARLLMSLSPLAGSCWAVSAASTMSDRLCIQTNGRKKMTLSDTDILACCGEFCGYG